MNSADLAANSADQAACQLRRIAVIGAGTAGRSFTRQLLRSGYDVTLEDVLPSNLRRAKDELGEDELGEGTCGDDERCDEERGDTRASGLTPRLHFVSTVEDAVRSADLAIDFVPDELESKLEILSMIDRMAPPGTILLTPTDVLSISDLASCTYRPERCFGVSGLSRDRPFSEDAVVTLLHPAGSSAGVLRSVEDLLRSLHVAFTTQLDPHPSLLVGRR